MAQCQKPVTSKGNNKLCILQLSVIHAHGLWQEGVGGGCKQGICPTPCAFFEKIKIKNRKEFYQILIQKLKLSENSYSIMNALGRSIKLVLYISLQQNVPPASLRKWAPHLRMNSAGTYEHLFHMYCRKENYNFLWSVMNRSTVEENALLLLISALVLNTRGGGG